MPSVAGKPLFDFVSQSIKHPILSFGLAILGAVVSYTVVQQTVKTHSVEIQELKKAKRSRDYQR
jgi:hypothetical protein